MTDLWDETEPDEPQPRRNWLRDMLRTLFTAETPTAQPSPRPKRGKGKSPDDNGLATLPDHRPAHVDAVGHRLEPAAPSLDYSSESERMELARRIATMLGSPKCIVVGSAIGGAGKSVSAALVGRVFSDLHGVPVVVLDADVDASTLWTRVMGGVEQPSEANLRALVESGQKEIESYLGMRQFVAQDHEPGSSGGTHVIGADPTPSVPIQYEADFNRMREAIARLQLHFPIVVVDTGTGILHPYTVGALSKATSLVMPVTGTKSSVKAGVATIHKLLERDWGNVVPQGQFNKLVSEAVLVLNHLVPENTVLEGDDMVPDEQIASYFGSLCRHIVTTPWDEHLAPGSRVRLEQCSPESQLAWMRVAAHVADTFSTRTNGIHELPQKAESVEDVDDVYARQLASMAQPKVEQPVDEARPTVVKRSKPQTQE